MFGWFGWKPQCPLDPMTRQWFDTRWAWLESQFGRDQLLKRRVVLPGDEFFPDPYEYNEAGARLIFERVCSYMDIDLSTVRMSLFDSSIPGTEVGYISNAVGLYTQEGDQFHIMLEISNLLDPLKMVSTIAHELGHVHLLGHGRISAEEEDHEPLTDLLTVFFGMGIFSANSVIRELNMRVGNIYGWSVSRQGYIGMELSGYALAKFAFERGELKPKWARELRLDVRSAFKRSLRYFKSEASDSLRRG